MPTLADPRRKPIINFPPLPDTHAIAAMVPTVVALVLFTCEKIPLETSSMTVLALLAVGFELFPDSANGRSVHAMDFFHGFGHKALVAVCALMIVGQGLVVLGGLVLMMGVLMNVVSSNAAAVICTPSR